MAREVMKDLHTKDMVAMTDVKVTCKISEAPLYAILDPIYAGSEGYINTILLFFSVKSSSRMYGTTAK